MNIDREKYKKYAESHAPRSPIIKDCLLSFLFGGAICTIAQALIDLYEKRLGMLHQDAATLTSVTLIFIAVTLTAAGIFDKIAKHAGAGTLVPITGFANSVVSPAIDSKAEGFILGVGAKIFTVAGPVLLYGTLAGAVYGLIYWLLGMAQALS